MNITENVFQTPSRLTPLPAEELGVDPRIRAFAEQTAFGSRESASNNYLFSKAKSGYTPEQAVSEVDSQITNLTRTPSQIIKETTDKIGSLNKPVAPVLTNPFDMEAYKSSMADLQAVTGETVARPFLQRPDVSGLDLLVTGLAGLGNARNMGEITQVPLQLAQQRSEFDNKNNMIAYENALADLEARRAVEELRVKEALKNGEIKNSDAIRLFAEQNDAYQNEVRNILASAELEIGAFNANQKDETNRLKIENDKLIKQAKSDMDILDEYHKLPFAEQQKPEVIENFKARVNGRVNFMPMMGQADVKNQQAIANKRQSAILTGIARAEIIKNNFNNLSIQDQKDNLKTTNDQIAALEKALGIGKILPRVTVSQKEDDRLAIAKFLVQQEQFNKKLAIQYARLAKTDSRTSNKLDYKTNSGQTLGSLQKNAQKLTAEANAANNAVLDYQKRNPTATMDNNAALRELITKRDAAAIKASQANTDYEIGAQEVDNKNLGKKNYSPNAEVNKQKQKEQKSTAPSKPVTNTGTKKFSRN